MRWHGGRLILVMTVHLPALDHGFMDPAPVLATVHVADLAAVFRHVLEDDCAHGRYVIGNGMNSTVAELTEAAAVAAGTPGAVPGSDDEARARLGDYFAEVLLLDQGTDAAKARAELGWHPSRPSLPTSSATAVTQMMGGWPAAGSRGEAHL